MNHRFIARAFAFVFAALCATAAHATGPTLGALLLQDANGAPQSECITTTGGLFYVCHLNFGVNPTTGLPAPLLVDPTTGGLDVNIVGTGALSVSGSVSITNLPATQPVSGTVSVSNLPSTQAISAGALPLPAGAARDVSITGAQAAAGANASTANVIQGIAGGVAVAVTTTPAAGPFGGMTATLLSAVNAATTGTAVPHLFKDSYLFSCTATTWNSASAQLEFLGPDGVTWLNFASVALTANGVIGVGIGANATVRAAVTGTPTALSCNLS